MSEKVKLYKNSARNKSEKYNKYIPQYQKKDIEPTLINSAIVPESLIGISPKPSAENPRLPRLPIRQSYAKEEESPIGRGKSAVPNVGNNFEHTWSALDGVIDDLTDYDTNRTLEDNNDFINESIYNLPSSDQLGEDVPQLDDIENIDIFTSDDVAHDLVKVVKDMSDSEYLLLVDNLIIHRGPHDIIQKLASDMLLGENGDSVPLDKILIIKKIPIKIGVFIG